MTGEFSPYRFPPRRAGFVGGSCRNDRRLGSLSPLHSCRMGGRVRDAGDVEVGQDYQPPQAQDVHESRDLREGACE